MLLHRFIKANSKKKKMFFEKRKPVPAHHKADCSQSILLQFFFHSLSTLFQLCIYKNMRVCPCYRNFLSPGLPITCQPLCKFHLGKDAAYDSFLFTNDALNPPEIFKTSNMSFSSVWVFLMIWFLEFDELGQIESGGLQAHKTTSRGPHKSRT